MQTYREPSAEYINTRVPTIDGLSVFVASKSKESYSETTDLLKAESNNN